MSEIDPASILEHAAAAIRERAASRDTPAGERSMARAVGAFNGLMGGDRRLTEAEGWLFMCCLKMARGTSGTPNLDDAIDLAGYAGLWGECYSAPKQEPGTVIEHHRNCTIFGWGNFPCNCGAVPPK